MYLSELRHEIRARVGLHPWLFYKTFGLKSSNRNLVVRRTTEIIIEGYPRSANTFATLAFQIAQNRDVAIGHHLHVPAQIMRAVRWGIPAIVLLRKPGDAVLSLLVRYPNASVGRCLQEYSGFYKSIFELREKFLVARFEIVTSDFGKIVEGLNRKFGTGFIPFENTSDNVAAVFSRIDAIHSRARRGSEQIARPTMEKDELKQEMIEKMSSTEFTDLYNDAESWYQRYRLLADV